MSIDYSLESDLSAEDFRAILIASNLADRRPVDDLGRLDAMLRNAGLVFTARDDARLVGVSRAITDFSYCCYLADLAVDHAYQRRGIGRRLVAETRNAVGEGVTLLLMAAPAAQDYYPKIGMTPVHNGWMLARSR